MPACGGAQSKTPLQIGAASRGAAPLQPMPLRPLAQEACRQYCNDGLCQEGQGTLQCSLRPRSILLGRHDTPHPSEVVGHTYYAEGIQTLVEPARGEHTYMK